MELKKYQQKAIQEGRTRGLIPPTFDALTTEDDQNIQIVLKAITGSGKTVIASDYIEKVLTADPEERGSYPICFIWLSKGNGMLHIQSSDKIKSYISDPSIHVIGIEKSSDFKALQFYDNDVYVINWEKLYSDNNLVTETENPNLPNAVKNTPDDMRYILIVDEFHAGYEQETYTRIVALFNPIIILGMTATPTAEQWMNADSKVEVRVKDIQAEAMVKLGIKFNAQSELPTIDSYQTREEYFLKLALARRDLLEKQYKEEGSDVIPLLLIQFDDEGNGRDVDSMISSTIEILDGIYSNNSNNDYAIWMDVKKGSSINRSEDQVIRNLDTNKVKVLLFKQAIATGWDCPRAQIILRYRRINNVNGTFDLQTLGRIFRMPEPYKGTYYNNPALNYGYVYSTDNSYRLEQSFAESLRDSDSPAFGNTKDYYQKVEYKPVALKLEGLLKDENNSVITKKPSDDDLCDEVDRLAEAMNWILELPELNSDETYNEYVVELSDNMKINIDEHRFVMHQTSRIREQLVNKQFLDAIPTSYSQIVRDQIMTDIRRELNVGQTIDDRNILILVNNHKLTELMKSLDDYCKKHENRYQGENRDFKFPGFISILENEFVSSEKNLYGVSSSNFSNPEKIFISELEKKENVLFWYKNTDSGKDAFCVAYDVNKQKEPTYPDFLVAFKDETFGIYEIKDEADTKSNIPNKKDGIEKRVRELNKKHKGKFHGTLFKVNIKNGVVIDLDSYPEFG